MIKKIKIEFRANLKKMFREYTKKTLKICKK